MTKKKIDTVAQQKAILLFFHIGVTHKQKVLYAVFFYDQAAHFFGYILSGAMNLLFLVTQSVVNDTYDAHTQQSRKKRSV